MNKPKKKARMLVWMLLLVAVLAVGCSGEDADGDAISGGETGTGGELVLGRNL